MTGDNMKIKSVNVYVGECPICGCSQTSLKSEGVDVICTGCKYVVDEIFDVFKIKSTDLQRNKYNFKEYELLTNVKQITCMDYKTESQYEMLLPGGIKKIRRLKYDNNNH